MSYKVLTTISYDRKYKLSVYVSCRKNYRELMWYYKIYILTNIVANFLTLQQYKEINNSSVKNGIKILQVSTMHLV